MNVNDNVVELLSIKEFYNNLLNEHKLKREYNTEYNDIILTEINDRINNYNSLIDNVTVNDTQKLDAKHDLYIILEALQIVVKKDLKNIGDILSKYNQCDREIDIEINKDDREINIDKEKKQILINILDQFKMQSDILMKIISYRIVI
jgi:hypothetical protein